MSKITRRQAKEMMQKYDVDENIVDLDTFLYALNVELEHGTRAGFLNVSDDNLDITTKIALAHLEEHYLYYKYLKKMEKTLDDIPNMDIFVE